MIKTPNMNKTELLAQISEETGFTKADCQKTLDAITDAIARTLKNDGMVQLVGFGTFSVTERKERMGIDPQTRLEIRIPAKKVAKWKPSKNILD